MPILANETITGKRYKTTKGIEVEIVRNFFDEILVKVVGSGQEQRIPGDLTLHEIEKEVINMGTKNNGDNGGNGNKPISRRQRILELLEKGKKLQEIHDSVMEEFADRKPDSRLVIMQIRVNAHQLGYQLK